MQYKNRGVTKAEIVAHLRGLADGSIKPVRPDRGLCSEMGEFFYGYKRTRRRVMARDKIKQAMRKWEHYSGIPDYPVPHPRLNAGAAYDMTGARGKWSAHGAYGRKRRELCDYLAGVIQRSHI